MRPRAYLKPWIFGLAAGTLFVLAEAVLPIYPPSAYAFCLSCHVRDLVDNIVNAIASTRFQTTEVGGRALLLTSPGLLIGAFLAARAHRETKPRRATRALAFALAGAAMMIMGIVIFGCPTRLALRAGYGDVYGIAGLLGLFAGITVTTLVSRRRAARGATKGEAR